MMIPVPVATLGSAGTANEGLIAYTSDGVNSGPGLVKSNGTSWVPIAEADALAAMTVTLLTAGRVALTEVAVTALPAAAAGNKGQIAYTSNGIAGAAGAVISNGTNWVYLHDNATTAAAA